MGLFQIDISQEVCMVKHLHFGIGCQTFAYHFALWRCHIGGWRQTCEVVRGLALTRWSPWPFWGNWMEMPPVLPGISIFETQVHSLCYFWSDLEPKWCALDLKTEALVREEATVLCLWWIFATPTVSKQPSPEAQGKHLFAAFCSSALPAKCQKLADRMRSRFFLVCVYVEVVLVSPKD